ncbi:response regulator transcription factor [uncultured Bifidobacterium sp.]|uniref:response regulator transcription factor n=1 Tax=uncultured Bifidobacterium sp. TaxID=165187 RepID=UPI00260B8CDE|nr:response regulator transcription factor [uncultured Bifidobacterium sp.]
MVEHRGITLAIVDNDRFTLQAMSGFLSKALPKSFALRWTCDNPRRAIARCVEDPPDVLLVDMSLGDMDGVQVIREIRERDAHIGLIAVTSFPLWEYAADAADAGAQGIVGKNDLPAMIALIRRVASGLAGADYGDAQFDVPQAAFTKICQGDARNCGGLSPRESDIVKLCSLGDTTTDVAKALGISEASVNTHLRRACTKLGARNRVHLVALWMRLNRPRR